MRGWEVICQYIGNWLLHANSINLFPTPSPTIGPAWDNHVNWSVWTKGCGYPLLPTTLSSPPRARLRCPAWDSNYNVNWSLWTRARGGGEGVAGTPPFPAPAARPPTVGYCGLGSGAHPGTTMFIGHCGRGCGAGAPPFSCDPYLSLFHRGSRFGAHTGTITLIVYPLFAAPSSHPLPPAGKLSGPILGQ